MRIRELAIVLVLAMSMPATAIAADSPYVAVTAAEKRQTGLLAEPVVTAYRTGRLSILCDLLSPADVNRLHGSARRASAARLGDLHTTLRDQLEWSPAAGL